MKIENPLIVRFLTINLVGIHNQDLPDYVKEQGINCLRFEPVSIKMIKIRLTSPSYTGNLFLKKRPTKIGKKARMR